MERIGGLHVALFLVLLSPGYNPPRRRWCLYLSRGKPPSVRVSLPLAFTRPFPSHLLSATLSLSFSLSLARSLSPSTFWQPALPLSRTPSSLPPRNRLSTLLVNPDTLYALLPVLLPPDSTHRHPSTYLHPPAFLPQPPAPLPRTLTLPTSTTTATLLTSAAFIRRSNSPQRTPY